MPGLWTPQREIIRPWPGIIVPKRGRLPRLPRVPWPSPAPWLFAPVFVQQAGGDANAASVTATFGSAVTAGNVVIAMASGVGSGNVTLNVTGLTSPSWAVIRDSDVQAQGHKMIWAATPTGGTVVTLTPSASARIGLTVVEFSGLTVTTDGLNSAGGNSSSPATGNITTANASDLIVIMTATFPNTATGDPPTGYTQLTQRTVSVFQMNDYQIVSGTGTYSGAWTLTGGADNWEALIAAFQASAAPGGVSYQPWMQRGPVLAQ